MFSKPQSNQSRVGLPTLEIRPVCLPNILKLTGLESTNFVFAEKAHSVVRACDDVVYTSYMLKQLKYETTPGHAVLMLGPDKSEIIDLMNISTSTGQMFTRYIVSYLDVGGDAYDFSRINMTDPNNPLEDAIYRSFYNHEVVTYHTISVVPYSMLNEFIRNFDTTISTVTSRNAWVSGNVLKKVDLLCEILKNNVSHGIILLPKFHELLPLPEEMRVVKHTPYRNSLCGYVLTLVPERYLQSDSSGDVLAFMPSDCSIDKSKVYYEDKNHWVESTRDFWKGTDIFASVEEKVRVGVMVYRIITPVLAGVLRSTRHLPMYTLTLPCVKYGVFFNTYKLVTGDIEQAMKFAGVLAAKEADISAKSLWNKDLKATAAAYAQVVAHVSNIQTTSDHVIKGDYNSDRVVENFSLAVSICFLRNQQCDMVTYFNAFFEWLRTTFSIADIGAEEYLNWMRNSDPAHLALGTLGFDDIADVSSGFVNFFKPQLCFNQFLTDAGLPIIEMNSCINISTFTCDALTTLFSNHPCAPLFKLISAREMVELVLNKNKTKIIGAVMNGLKPTVYFAKIGKDNYHIEWVGPTSQRLNSTDGFNLANAILSILCPPMVPPRFFPHPHVNMVGDLGNLTPTRIYQPYQFKNAFFEAQLMKEAALRNDYFVYRGMGTKGFVRMLDLASEYGVNEVHAIDIQLDASSFVEAANARNRYPQLDVHLYASDADFSVGHEVRFVNVGSALYSINNDPGPMPMLFRIPPVIPQATAHLWQKVIKLNQKYYDWLHRMPNQMYYNFYNTFGNIPPCLVDPVTFNDTSSTVDVNFGTNLLLTIGSDRAGFLLGEETFIFAFRPGDVARYLAAAAQVAALYVPDRRLTAIRPKNNNETAVQYQSYIGSLVLTSNRNQIAFRMMPPRLVPRGYVLYDDAYLAGDTPTYTAVHAAADCYLAKLHVYSVAPEFISVADGCHLFTCPTGSSFEFRFGNFNNAVLDHVNVENFGVDFVVFNDRSKTYRFTNLIDKLVKSSLFSHECRDNDCYIHALSKLEMTPTMNTLGNEITHGGMHLLPSRLHNYINNNYVTINEKYFNHVDSTRREQMNLSWFNSEECQAFIFEKQRIRDATFTYKLERDPLYDLDRSGAAVGIVCIAGFGKTKMFQNHKACYFSPYAKVAKQNKKRFAEALTYEVGVSFLLTDTQKYDYMVIDEAHAMGPLLFFYANEAKKRNIPLYLLGDYYQIPWACRNQNIDGSLKRQMEFNSSPRQIFNIHCEVSFYSRRFGPHMAYVLSRLLGVRIHGLNTSHTVQFHFANNVEEAILNLTGSEESVITLTQEVKDLVHGNVCTATESGGSNDNTNTVILLGKNSSLPFPQELDEKQIFSHEYVALSRSCVHSTVYIPQNWHGFERTSILLPAPSPTNLIHSMPRRCSGFYKNNVSGFNTSMIIATDSSKSLQGFKQVIAANRPELRVSVNPVAGEYDIVLLDELPERNVLPVSDRIFVRPKRAVLTQQFRRDPTVQFNFELKIRHREALFMLEEARKLGFKNVSSIEEAISDFGTVTGDLDYDSPLQKLRNTVMNKSTDFEHYSTAREKQFRTTMVALLDVRSDNESGKTTLMSNMITIGAESPEYFSYNREKMLKGVMYTIDEKNELHPSFEEYFPVTTTGQFHGHHLEAANYLIRENYEVEHVINGVLYIGQSIDFTKSIKNYQGGNVRYNLYTAMATTTTREVKMFCLNPATKFQFNTASTNLASTFSRYGKQPYKLFMASLPPLDAVKLEKQYYSDFEFISKSLVGTMFKVSSVEDYELLLVKHGIDYLCSQSCKGSMVRTPTIADLYEQHNSFVGGMKVQTKHPDEYKVNWLFSDKCGQPVQVMSAGWMAALSPRFRFLSELLHNAMGERLQFMGPDFPIKRLWQKLAPHVKWSNTIGGDLSECDASHIPIFVDFVRMLLFNLYPSLDPAIINSTLLALSSVMDTWNCRSRDSTYRVQVFGQLASGSPWTFLWNCLWTMFNFCVLLCEEFGRNKFLEVLGDLVLGVAGDDFFFSTNQCLELTTKTYINSFRAQIKISVEPYAVIFCHNTFTEVGVFPDPLRTLSKFLSKPIEGTEAEINEMKVALNDLFKDYRDTSNRSYLCECRELRFGVPVQLTEYVLDLIFRVCNTPEKKLQNLLTDVKLVTAHFNPPSF